MGKHYQRRPDVSNENIKMNFERPAKYYQRSQRSNTLGSPKWKN